MLVFSVMVFIGCDEEDDYDYDYDYNEIIINILEFGVDEVVADVSDVYIYIEVEVIDINYDIDIVFYLDGDVEIKIIDQYMYDYD